VPALGPELSQLARQHHAVITLADAAAAGTSAKQLRRATDAGTLERVHPGVYRVAAAPRSWSQRLYIAVLAGGDGALASHRSAHALWGLDGSTRGVPEVVTPRHLRGRAELARYHESTDLHLAEPTVREGIPCTGLVRTLVDLGAVAPPERVQQAIDDAIRRRLCSWEDLAHALARHSRRGRNGLGPFRAVLEATYGTVIPDSHFNRLVERLLIAAGLPAPTLEHPVVDAHGLQVARVDLAYPPWKVALELDSRRHHLSAGAFEHDRARQNGLELLGWTVLRYTWLQYSRTAGKILADTSAALRRAGWDPTDPTDPIAPQFWRRREPARGA
jgi:hypothetical protein